MIKVKRPKEPLSLADNADKWTSELLAKIDECEKFSKVPKKYKNKYNEEDVRQALQKMYGEKCCYCEVGIGVASYSHIEHRKPKSKFPESTFEWDNLHLSCQICNMEKVEKWNYEYPILDLSKDNPNDFIEFDVISCKVLPKSTPGRGAITIEHTKLNRDELVKARRQIRKVALAYIEIIKNTNSKSDDEVFRRLLEDMIAPNLPNGIKAEHSQFIRKIKEVYLDN